MSNITCSCPRVAADIISRRWGVFDSSISQGGYQFRNNEMPPSTMASNLSTGYWSELACLLCCLHLDIFSRGLVQDNCHLVADHDIRRARIRPRDCEHVLHSSRNLLWSPRYRSWPIYLEIHDTNKYVEGSLHGINKSPAKC